MAGGAGNGAVTPDGKVIGQGTGIAQVGPSQLFFKFISIQFKLSLTLIITNFVFIQMDSASGWVLVVQLVSSHFIL